MSATENELPADAPAPRLCHLVKWPDFDGYGFNLHAEKSRAGQYIGKVDEDSPAELAGLREGDRIIEVNNVNIANENHRQVVERIKSVPNETKLLVVEDAADRWYKERKMVVKSTQPNVIYVKTPLPRPSKENSVKEAPQSSPSAGTPSPKPSSSRGTPSPVPQRNVNGVKPITIPNDKPNLERQDSASSNSLKQEANSHSSTPPPANGSINEPIPDSPQSAKSSHSQNGPSPAKTGESRPADLNLNMSASEMRQLLAARKKKDPKNTQMDLRQKYEIIQQM